MFPKTETSDKLLEAHGLLNHKLGLITLFWANHFNFLLKKP